MSWKLFLPLSRLVYAAYIINPNLIKVFLARQRVPLYFDISEIGVAYSGIIILAFLASFVAHVTVEKPFINLAQLILSQPTANNSTR